jgi:hypothetical protein
MRGSQSASDAAATSIDRRYNAGVPRERDRDHFLDDGEFDVVRFILQTTNEVWDQQRFERIRDYFAEEFVSYGAQGREFGDLDELYAYALPRTSAFPDTKVFVDDLLWVGDEEQGFKTSHSFTVTGTNTGSSEYGPPTGKRLRLTGIANCTVERVDGQWQYTEERAEDDQFAIHRACTPGDAGTYPDVPAPADVEDGSDTTDSHESTAAENGPATGTPVGERASTEEATPSVVVGPGVDRDAEGFDPVDHLRGLVDDLWNDHSVGRIDDYYAEDVVVEAASGRRLRDTAELRAEVLERLSAFPDLEVTVDEVLVVARNGGYDTSVAYTATGTHAAPSKYGSTDGRQITFTGIVNQKLRRVGGVWRVVHCREDFDERRLMRLLG